MSRSLKKGLFVDEKLLKKVNSAKSGETIKTWSRSSMITPEMVGINMAIHNGKEHIGVTIIEEMVGHRLGEFSPTRKFRKHGGRMAREQEKTETTK
ncbi:MAG: 30S ribosomal protein S19 [bacterium]